MKNLLRKSYWLQSQERKKEKPMTAVSVYLKNFLGKICLVVNLSLFPLYFTDIDDHLYQYRRFRNITTQAFRILEILLNAQQLCILGN